MGFCAHVCSVLYLHILSFPLFLLYCLYRTGYIYLSITVLLKVIDTSETCKNEKMKSGMCIVNITFDIFYSILCVFVFDNSSTMSCEKKTQCGTCADWHTPESRKAQTACNPEFISLSWFIVLEWSNTQ